jgi:hypothetical protein
MPMTQKEANQLNVAKAEVKGFWILACAAEGVDPESKFVAFSNDNNVAKMHNNAMGEFFKLRSRIQRNMDRRDRHAVMSDMGLKRVKGAQGGTYYE